jgi:tetratricopeptide (TPR) repeat protein
MDERTKGAQEWFRKGTEAMNHKNWDYAIECFGTSMKLVPDNLLFRQTRHGCIRKKYDDNGTGARMTGVKLMGIRGTIKKCRMRKDWKGVETAAEKGLEINPWDAQLYFDLGEASYELENGDVAGFAMSRAVELDRDNIEFNRKLGHTLHKRGEFDGAIACFVRINKLLPTDADARSMISRLHAEKTMDRGKYNTADSTRDVKSEPEKPVDAYEQERQERRASRNAAKAAPGESASTDLQHAIRKDPKDLNNYLKLADVFRDERKLGKSVEILSEALEISDDNPDVREQLEDAQLAVMKEDLGEAVERARKNPGKQRLEDKAGTLKQELVKKEIDVYARRVERYPNDLRIKFDLAERYRNVKQWSKAIPLLQQSSSDSRIKGEALVALGECFIRDNKLDLGRRQFDKALEAINVHDHPDAFKKAHYFLARIYQKAGKTEQAEDHFHEILSIDYEYRDVLKRLESMADDSSLD